MIKIIHTRDFGVYIKLIFFFTKIRRLNRIEDFHGKIMKLSSAKKEHKSFSLNTIRIERMRESFSLNL